MVGLTIISPSAYAQENVSVHPAWSSDGQSILYLERFDGGAQIRQVSSDGRHATTVVANVGGGANPSLSPDRRFVAFVTQGEESGWSISIVDLKTKERRDLAAGETMIMHPQWSPDGRHISFIRPIEGQWDIFLVDPSDGTTNRVTHTDDRSEFHPKWSADGSKLIFDRNGPTEDGGTCYQIAETHVATGTTSVLLTVEGSARVGAPSFAPDGSAIVFSTSQGERDGIWKLDLGSGETTLLRSRGEGRGVGGPVYSPDGSQIAFHAHIDGRFEIVVMHADGSEELLLTS